jgi:hypothetical protein
MPALNKDNGLIDPDTGEATAPTTPRGMVGNDFARAVSGAIEETRRQWRDLRAELAVRYGREDASVMTCALTHDDPVDDCRDRGRGRVVIGVCREQRSSRCWCSSSTPAADAPPEGVPSAPARRRSRAFSAWSRDVHQRRSSLTCGG